LTDYEKKTVEKVSMLMKVSQKATAAQNERQIIRKMLEEAKKKKGPQQMKLF
jgi:hypothetical protein